MRVIIDRFEGIYAICEKENKTMIDIKKSELPNDCKEGDVLIINGDEIAIDKFARDQRSKEIEDLTEDMWE